MAVAAIAVLSSCSKEDDNNASLNDNGSFYATIEDGSTRTTLGSDKKVLWSTGDKISINGEVYTLSVGQGTTHATFEGPEGLTSPYNAYYPASLYNGGTPTLPAEQTYEAGKISNLPMYAQSTTHDLKFANLCGVIALTLKGTKSVKSIEVSSDQQMNGAFTATAAGILTFDSKTLEAADKKVTLDCGSGVTLNETTGVIFYIAIPAGSHQLTFRINTTDSYYYTKTTTSAVSVERNNIYPIVWTPAFIPEGALTGVFSISSTEKVYFSQGNLQYQASTSTWRLAENQADFIGNNLGNSTTNETTRSTQADWIDLFCWGTSGYNSIYPYVKSTYFTGNNNITGTYANYDWGVYNAISNAGNQAGLWRVLSKAEWDYMYDTRTVNGGTGENYTCKRCTIDGVYGMLIFPDGYTGTTNSATYASIPEGCAFLPAAGKYDDNTYTANHGYYWTSTSYAAASAYDPDFSSTNMSDTYGSKNHRRSVRLVTVVK